MTTRTETLRDARLSVKPYVDASMRLSRDILDLAASMTRAEVRALVDMYYQVQKQRIVMENQVTAASASEEPHRLLAWAMSTQKVFEDQIRRAMTEWTDQSIPGRWAKGIMGIGPVLAAGLLAHIDIEMAPTVGHIWRFAGADPTSKWEKGQRRPWNASLKVLRWKIGESFVKVKGRPADVYGKVYEARKAYETAKNLNGDYADQAAETLSARPTHKQRAIYADGRLPDGRIHLRAERYAVKLFLAHLHHVMYVDRYQTDPPKPYILTQPGHVHFIAPPNWPIAVVKESTVPEE